MISTVTLQCEPAFNLEEHAEPLDFERALDRLPKLLDENEHVKLWWLPHTERMEVYRANRTAQPPTAKAGRVASTSRRCPGACTRPLLRAGAVRPDAVPALNRVVAGYDVPELPSRGRGHPRVQRAAGAAASRDGVRRRREYGAAAMYALRDFIKREGLAVNFIVEMRFVAADENMLSPAHGRDTCQIGAYQFENRDTARYFAGFEALMLPMGGRPHWGKEHSVGRRAIREMYPLYDRFDEIRRELDPRGVFENAFVKRMFVD